MRRNVWQKLKSEASLFDIIVFDSSHRKIGGKKKINGKKKKKRKSGNYQKKISKIKVNVKEEFKNVTFPIHCKYTNEICKTYNEYLDSQHWSTFRHRYYSAHRRVKCAVCGKNKNTCKRKKIKLHLHHLSYERLGAEFFSDIVCLCAVCHARCHNRT